MKQFDLEKYLSDGVERIIQGIRKASVSNPKEGIFMLQYAKASRRARAVRQEAELNGEHIPPFLIASITDQCNLKCTGCYARANHACGDECHDGQLSAEKWGSIFSEADTLGIGFILLAGGEPFTRPDVLREAVKYKRILFPVFTNGTMMDHSYLKMFSDARNLVPILSLEGPRRRTDERRGEGVYACLQRTMKSLKEQGILYGVSVTVTADNMEEVTDGAFIEKLQENGCKAVIYVEYVPADGKSQNLAPTEDDRVVFGERLQKVREQRSQIVFISFPGDEKSSGGCLAAGRGFFHISAQGNAEPCPFSPYSDTSLLYTTLREALQSPLFRKLQADGILTQEHRGGCVLFEKEQQVKEALMP